MATPLITIIVPTYNDWTRLSLCVKALSIQSYPKAFFNVIIVNNNPDDTVPADLILPENFSLIVEKKPGSYAARNAALKIAKGEIIGFTDSDCIPDKDWIKNAVDHFHNDKTCARIAGNIFVFPKRSKATVAEMYDKLYAFRQKRYVDERGTCVTGNLFAYKYVFDAVGLFNDTQMSYGDLNWGIAAHNAGYRIDYVENVLVNHPARDLPELLKKEKRLAGGREKKRERKLDKLTVYRKFLDEVRPRFRGDIKFINDNGRHLTASERLAIMLLRVRIIYVRAHETMKLRLGKKPNRE